MNKTDYSSVFGTMLSDDELKALLSTLSKVDSEALSKEAALVVLRNLAEEVRRWRTGKARLMQAMSATYEIAIQEEAEDFIRALFPATKPDLTE